MEAPPPPFISKQVETKWQGRQIFGTIAMRDFAKWWHQGHQFPIIVSDQNEEDFAVYETKAVSPKTLAEVLKSIKDRRIFTLDSRSDLTTTKVNAY